MKIDTAITMFVNQNGSETQNVKQRSATLLEHGS